MCAKKQRNAQNRNKTHILRASFMFVTSLYNLICPIKHPYSFVSFKCGDQYHRLRTCTILLFSLKTSEQLQLISSLKDDFKGDELANILSPCLRINLDINLKSEIINILANSASYLAVKPLKKYVSCIKEYNKPPENLNMQQYLNFIDNSKDYVL